MHERPGLLEFALVVPLVLVLVLGVIEVSYALLDQHVVTKLTPRGLEPDLARHQPADAATAMRKMSSRPVNFTNGSSKVIFSVVKNVATVGASNYGKAVLYARYQYGTHGGFEHVEQQRRRVRVGPRLRGRQLRQRHEPADHQPAGEPCPSGGMLYVTEIYTRHPLITPFDRFGITVPQTLYSIAYF